MEAAASTVTQPTLTAGQKKFGVYVGLMVLMSGFPVEETGKNSVPSILREIADDVANVIQNAVQGRLVDSGVRDELLPLVNALFNKPQLQMFGITYIEDYEAWLRLIADDFEAFKQTH